MHPAFQPARVFAYMGMKTIVTDVVRRTTRPTASDGPSSARTGLNGVGCRIPTDLPQAAHRFDQQLRRRASHEAEAPGAMLRHVYDVTPKEGFFLQSARASDAAPMGGEPRALPFRKDLRSSPAAPILPLPLAGRRLRFTRSSGNGPLMPQTLRRAPQAPFSSCFVSTHLNRSTTSRTHIRLGEELEAKASCP